MAISLKLGKYKADPAPTRRFAALGWGKTAFALGIGAVVYFSVARSALESGASAAPRVESVGAAVPSPFSSNNWAGLVPGQPQVTARLQLDTDLECAEWETRETLKNLKAITVYEVAAPKERIEDAIEVAENVPGLRHR
jgi:hypothetical protein